jgi:hypothetical protein
MSGAGVSKKAKAISIAIGALRLYLTPDHLQSG